jgi:hypothetical protein
VLDALDDALRQFLIAELPAQSNEIDIAFHQPKREWSARLSRPTLNLYLYNLRENNKLRQSQPFWEVEDNGNGTSARRRRAVRLDVHYMITAWATDPDDEHRLLARALMAFMRNPFLAERYLPHELQDQPSPVTLLAAQYEMLDKPSDMWGVLDNEWRPVIPLLVTIAVRPDEPIVEPIVRSREVRVGQRSKDGSDSLQAQAGTGGFTVEGDEGRREPLRQK